MSRLLRLFASLSLLAILGGILLCSQNAQAEAQTPEPTRAPARTALIAASSTSKASLSVSLTEGNISEDFSVAKVKGAFGTVMDFNLIYNSYNADNSRASLDTMVGFGWTHTYNDFLFAQGSDHVSHARQWANNPLPPGTGRNIPD